MTEKDIVLACVRDEEDIIATFIEFYLAAGFDAIYLVDNDSRDATVAIAQGYAARGLPVFVKSDPRPIYERFLTDHFHWAGAASAARWIFFLDCDEMILFPGGVKAYLASLDSEVSCLQLRQREMYPLDSAPSAPHEYLLTTRGQEAFDETVKEVARYHPDAVVYAGKHRIDYPGVRRAEARGIFIRHYKFRSEEQARLKAVKTNNAHRGITMEEIVRTTAFDPQLVLGWYAHLIATEEHELWRESFGAAPSIEDPELAQWAAAHLLSG